MARHSGGTQLIIFGASGDLTRRKLMPALARLEQLDQLDQSVSIMGVARTAKTDDGFRNELAQAMPECLHESFQRLSMRV